MFAPPSFSHYLPDRGTAARNKNSERNERSGRDIASVGSPAAKADDFTAERTGGKDVKGIGTGRNGHESAGEQQALAKRRTARIDELRKERSEK